MTILSVTTIRRALLSVSDKTGLRELAAGLQARGIELISTGGTAKMLEQAGLKVAEVADVTRFPEILDGRVKTLHPAIHGGILARRDDALHQQALAKHKIAPIDLVVINLYPFAETYKTGKSWEVCIENIDIGGPAMIRAAAKNHHDVVVLTSPDHYTLLLAELDAHQGATSLAFREACAMAAYQHTARYDAAVAEAFAVRTATAFPETFLRTGQRVKTLRYGENPHQQAALYATGDKRPGVVTARQLQGKELSYNNINDTDAAYELVAEFVTPAAAIIKHANPSGVACGHSLSEAFERALACDPVSAFGGIIALNRPLDKAAAQLISQHFYEVVIAPGIEHEAEIILATKKNLRLLITDGLPDVLVPGRVVKDVAGGFLLQDADRSVLDVDALQVVTKRAPSKQELEDLKFAAIVAKHVKSNAIVYVRNSATVGIGAGQMSRIDAARIAVHKASEIAGNNSDTPLAGAVVASDAFFPFADGLLAAVAAGVTAVIQPGGSIRDDEVIAAADAHDVAMIFTGSRHFKH